MSLALATPAADATAAPGPTPLERARGVVRLAFVGDDDGTTRLTTLYQAGSGKARLPRAPAGAPPLAVLLNTAGGLTGGDRFLVEVSIGDEAAAVVTTQAAERVYRRLTGTARVETRMTVGRGARLSWLPQETIVFDGAGLERSLEVSLAPGARLLACEAIVLGRSAMGETVRSAEVRDRWDITIDGRLVFADRMRLVGDAEAILAGPATGGGARAFATLVIAGAGAAERLDAVRGAIEAAVDAAGGGVEAGASALEGVVVARLVASSATPLRATLARLLATLEDRPLPRVWSC
jgi:urease accessory protein